MVDGNCVAFKAIEVYSKTDYLSMHEPFSVKSMNIICEKYEPGFAEKIYLKSWSQKDTGDDHCEQEKDGVHDPETDQLVFKSGIYTLKRKQ